MIRRICREDGLTVLMSLHQVWLAREFSDRIVGIAGGAIVFDGSPAAVTEETLQAIYGMEDGIGDSSIGDPVPVLAHA